MMKLVFLSDTLNFSGGRKLLLEYADYLRSSGHEVDILVQRSGGALSDFTEICLVNDFSAINIPECDMIVTTTPREARQAFESKRSEHVVHFCQGFEITDLEQRVSGKVIPERYRSGCPFSRIGLFRKKLSWKKKIKKIDGVYSLPTHLVAVSPHLKKELEKRYGKNVYLCTNGVHREYFYPSEYWEFPEFSKQRPMKIVSVGPAKVTFKGIPYTMEAIRKLKKAGLPVYFIRVSPEITDDEKSSPLIDEWHENMTQDELGRLFRSSDVYVSNSTEGEGFGLPAMEAVSSGMIAVLSDISSYRNFSEAKDFCFFVPEHDANATAEVLKGFFDCPREKLAETRRKAIELADSYSHENACANFEKILNQILLSS